MAGDLSYVSVCQTRLWIAAFLTITALFYSVGCERIDIVARHSGVAPADAATSPDSDAANDAEQPLVDAETPYQGPADPSVRAGDTVICPSRTGTPAKRAFRYALCACDNFTVSKEPDDDELQSLFSTNTFDSSKEDLTWRGDGGSIGINSNGLMVNRSGALTIGGKLDISAITGSGGISLEHSPALSVSQNVAVQGPIQGGEAGVHVSGDALVGGRVYLNNFSVGGTFSIPPSAEVIVLGNQSIPPKTPVDPVVVPAPCGCSASDFLDLPSLISNAKTDPSRIDFDFSTFENYSGPVTLPLTAGLYYISHRLNGIGDLTIQVEGRVRLFIQGQVNFQGPGVVKISLGPNAELDLFLASGLVANTPDKIELQFGQEKDAGRVRLFVFGDIELRWKTCFAGSVYAPNSHVKLAGETEIFGSMFVNRVESFNLLKIHYDRNPTQSGNPDQSCD